MARTIRINGIDVPVIADEMTGADIKAAAGVDDNRVLIRQDADRNTIVGDSQRVRVADGDVFAHHARHSKAVPGTHPAATDPIDSRTETADDDADAGPGPGPGPGPGAGDVHDPRR
ncbi:hypothetical protein [Frankia sp. Cr2]|uniref:hypothetical protein n=1 Tax=Frankia sp. Cr2 TaxID=3073932 RepID=UPI002AD56F91|nr:hypothetical protein [Frankia sp. Cr2]